MIVSCNSPKNIYKTKQNKQKKLILSCHPTFHLSQYLLASGTKRTIQRAWKRSSEALGQLNLLKLLPRPSCCGGGAGLVCGKTRSFQTWNYAFWDVKGPTTRNNKQTNKKTTWALYHQLINVFFIYPGSSSGRSWAEQWSRRRRRHSRRRRGSCPAGCTPSPPAAIGSNKPARKLLRIRHLTKKWLDPLRTNTKPYWTYWMYLSLCFWSALPRVWGYQFPPKKKAIEATKVTQKKHFGDLTFHHVISFPRVLDSAPGACPKPPTLGLVVMGSSLVTSSPTCSGEKISEASVLLWIVWWWLWMWLFFLLLMVVVVVVVGWLGDLWLVGGGGCCCCWWWWCWWCWWWWLVRVVGVVGSCCWLLVVVVVVAAAGVGVGCCCCFLKWISVFWSSMKRSIVFSAPNSKKSLVLLN